MMTMRSTILNQIREHLLSSLQWAGSKHFDNALLYASKAEGLIELLEVEDCGSFGGFDPENPLDRVNQWDLSNRFYTLCKKYDQMEFVKGLQ